MKLQVILCKTCVDFKKERDFYIQKCREYEKQLAEKDKSLHKALSKIDQLKEMPHNSNTDPQNKGELNQKLELKIHTRGDFPQEKFGDSPVIPRMRLSKIHADAEMKREQWQLVALKTQPPDYSSDEDSLPLSKYLALKMEPEVLLEEGENNSGQDSNEQIESEPPHQICRWKTDNNNDATGMCGKECLQADLVSHINTDHIGNALSTRNMCMWEYCERYSREFKLRSDLLRHIYYHVDKSKRRRSSKVCKPAPKNNAVQVTIPCTYRGCSKLFKSTTMLDVHCRRFHIGVKKITDCAKRVLSDNPKFCCVQGCTSTSQKPNVILHNFPRSPKLHKVWIGKLKPAKRCSSILRVCNHHFLPCDYVSDSAGGQKRRLKPNSVPSQCLPP